jgi:hypothetical protein
MGKFKNYIIQKVHSLLGTADIKKISEEIIRLREITENTLIVNHLNQYLYHNEYYTNSKRITHFHKSVYTQNGEDGIIEEVFKRIGTTNKFFVEFGVHGIKNNATYLLLKGWQGLWIGDSNTGKQNVLDKFRSQLKEKKLIFKQKRIIRKNIENIFQESEVPETFDFLSIDIDGNDYWIWDTIKNYHPRLVSIEYNATFPPDFACVMAYDPDHQWDQTSYFGSSLLALDELGRKKGYKLIGCDFTGCNAFFLRDDQNLALFEKPFSAKNHYEPPRYFLRKSSGHRPGMGDFVIMK